MRRRQDPPMILRTLVAFSAGVFLLAAGQTGDTMSLHAAEPGMETAQEDIDLEAFIRAYPRVESVRQQYLPAIERAESREDKRRLMREAHGDMKQVIEDEGLTIEQYSRVSVAVSEDPELKQDVRELLEAPE